MCRKREPVKTWTNRMSFTSQRQLDYSILIQDEQRLVERNRSSVMSRVPRIGFLGKSCTRAIIYLILTIEFLARRRNEETSLADE